MGFINYIKSKFNSKSFDIDESDLQPKPVRNLRTILAKYTKIKYKNVKIFLAEMLGEIIYITIGLSSIAQYKLQIVESVYLSDPLALYVGYSVGLMFAILIVGKISGPNISTAITFARLLAGDIGFGTFLIYAVAQFLGAFIGAVLVFIIYMEPISNHPAGMHSIDTAGIFSTYPTGKLTNFEDFFIQAIATAVLIMLFLALTDKKNHQVSHGFIALFLGFAILMKTCAFSYSLSNSINPARDFAPRLFTYIAGWGPQVWTYDNYFFWIPLVSPFVGSFFGTFIYLIIVSSQIDDA